MSTLALPDTLKQIIDENRLFVTVATVGRDGHPHQTVTWLDRDGEELLYSTTTDRVQGRNLARDPRISVLITAPGNPYLYAEVKGTATLTPDPEMVVGNRISRKYTGQDYADFNPDAVNDGPRVTVRITPQKITGRL
ncbi:PPOX class F420-dependent oxidoreductase [Nocardia carnea]|uniref:PPOX class F420-dependent oxidoreductase n=1 Tax=Nocardia carnea TaxID=37328 RepID=UPI002454D3AB|nr:PPOX class F420-dependent oxidoreductase [Nocardia carnea]